MDAKHLLGPIVSGGPAMLGMTPAPVSLGAASALPHTEFAAGDGGAKPWSPDSPLFWLAGFTLVAVFGAAGASARVRIFRGRAQASVGTT